MSEPIYINAAKVAEYVDFITPEDELAISKVLVKMSLTGFTFPAMPQDDRLQALFTGCGLNPELAEWLLSFEYASKQELAQQIEAHNANLIQYLTAS